ncbi:hypothetical protein PLESTB_000497100 [Pleodorina starrii]|uniref:SKP1-like protein n=1 Tax=Pleodorina starrii TaxID=330485 RepID=A0A9W6F0J4_9CHLO|nr:hypothetical protein PLESTM_000368500 [Pleodorina starrii]GLC51390.1 hypothetical protein PLESTB_000497100 [Pleodorina starrii]GLC63756.1 hypothetical protein PLESTF_000070700 [Pleodorina starrii]
MNAKLTLTSNDGQKFEVEKEVALQSQMIKGMLEDIQSAASVPLANVNGQTLAKVVEYCKFHYEATKKGDTQKTKAAIKKWDKAFLNVEQSVLFDLILAANYLHVESLLQLTCQAAAKLICNKTTQEIRDMFNIENDLTAEDEAQLLSEIEWKFE